MSIIRVQVFSISSKLRTQRMLQQVVSKFGTETPFMSGLVINKLENPFMDRTHISAKSPQLNTISKESKREAFRRKRRGESSECLSENADQFSSRVSIFTLR